MPHRRCDLCDFWLPNDNWGGPNAEWEKTPADDRNGGCHRNAPRPTLGDFEHEIMKHLTSLAWEVSDEHQQKTNFLSWEEAEFDTCSWPQTRGSDWCGEFRRKH